MNWIKNILIVVVVSLLTIKAVDFGFSLKIGNTAWLKPSTRSIILRELDPGQRIYIAPSPLYLEGTDSLEAKEYLLRIDENGFIETGNIKESKSSDEDLSILFLGGSTTETIYVEEHNRFPSIVERELTARLNINVAVRNGGVSGNNALHSLLKLMAVGLEDKPDYAVLMHNINDASILSKTGSYWIAPKSAALVQNNAEIWNQHKLENFNLLILARDIKNILFPNLYAYFKPRLFPGIGPVLPVDEFEILRKDQELIDPLKIKSEFRNTLISFVELCRIWNVEPVLMTQFNRINENEPLFELAYKNDKSDRRMPRNKFVELYHDFNEIIRTVAKDRNVLFIDLAKRVPGVSKYIYDTVHLNDTGSILVGNILVNEFVKFHANDQ